MAHGFPVLKFVYWTIIPWARVGYEMIDSQRGAKRRVGYNHLISNKREWNNCFIKNAPKYRILGYNNNKKAQKLTHTLAIFVDHGIMAHIP